MLKNIFIFCLSFLYWGKKRGGAVILRDEIPRAEARPSMGSLLIYLRLVVIDRSFCLVFCRSNLSALCLVTSVYHHAEFPLACRGVEGACLGRGACFVPEPIAAPGGLGRSAYGFSR